MFATASCSNSAKRYSQIHQNVKIVVNSTIYNHCIMTKYTAWTGLTARFHFKDACDVFDASAMSA
eukprot:6197822-Pleurochrysis_carterae.AAC.5